MPASETSAAGTDSDRLGMLSSTCAGEPDVFIDVGSNAETRSCPSR
jgi:hypothetical protein